LLSVRQEHAVVALGGEIYVIGGFTPNVTATVEAFDPENGSWRRVADFPATLHHANAAAIDGKLYVAGFYLGASFTNADGRVFEYDPEQDAWSERGVMPAGTERASACVAAFDGKIYLFGGARAGSVADASVYDVATNSWQELPPLLQAREHCVAGEIDGNLYIAAGRSNGIGGFEPSTWAFDPISATYAPRAFITTPRGGAAGAVAGGRLYVFGGEGNNADPGGVFATVEAYDPVTDSWQALPAMLAPRHGLGAAALEDRIYLPGGAATQGFGAAGDHTVMRFDAPAP
jgi:N-acetylneuraminic acid mutarotase